MQLFQRPVSKLSAAASVQTCSCGYSPCSTGRMQQRWRVKMVCACTCVWCAATKKHAAARQQHRLPTLLGFSDLGLKRMYIPYIPQTSFHDKHVYRGPAHLRYRSRPMCSMLDALLGPAARLLPATAVRHRGSDRHRRQADTPSSLCS